MKQLLSITFLLALLVSGCSQEEIVIKDQVNLKLPKVTACFDQKVSRTYIEDGKHLRWNKDDQISLFYKSTLNSQYQFDGETGDNAGTFSPVNQVIGTGNDLASNYAVYPYASNTKITEDGVITVILPSEQSYANNSFGLEDNTMVAVTEDINDTFLKFKNVGGYLMLQLYGEDVTVKSITLTGNNNEKLAGESKITSTYGDEPGVEMTTDESEASGSITLDCGEGVKLGTSAESATAFWFVIPPTTFEKGFTITVTDLNGGEFTKSTSKSIEIERNVVQPMSAFEVECKKILVSNYFNGIANVANAGELSSIIPDDEKLTITSLKISGYLNGDDIICLRQMLGGNEFGDKEKGRLTSLDLSESSIVEGGNSYYTNKNYYPTKTNYTSYNVIGDYMFFESKNLQNIILPNNVTSIGDGAFSGCSSLVSIEIPSNVTSIGSNVFNACSSMTSIDIPVGITSIKSNAFAYCSSLASIVIPNEVTSIEAMAFEGCSSLVSIDIPDGIAYIEYGVFAGCSSLKSIVVPKGVISISQSAFSNCSSLTSIDIPDSVTSIEKWAFSGCRSLRRITIGNGLTSLDNFDFDDYSSLSSVTIGDGITTIGDRTFSGCKSLSSVSIGKGVSSIGENAFSDCSSLNSIKIPDGVTSIGSSAFYNCKLLKTVTIGNGVTSIGENTFRYCNSLTTVTMGENIETIGQSAFYDCTSLTTINIPNAITTLEAWAFSGCSSLSSVTLGKNVTNIGSYTFYNCKSLKSINIPNSVTLIDFLAFEGCSLNSVFINDLSAWCKIKFNGSDRSNPLHNGAKLYLNNNELTELIIPKGITEIKNYAFSGCSSINKVIVDEDVTSIGYSAFCGCPSLKTVTIGEAVTSIDSYVFGYCNSLTDFYCYSITPPKIITLINGSEGPTFNGLNKDLLTLHVPKGYDTIYKSSDWGNYFAKIINID